MAAKLTTEQLLARLKQVQIDTGAFKTYWLDYFSPDLPYPPDHEIKSAVRRLPLADLAVGMEAYAKVIYENPDAEITFRTALNYICGTAWNVHEQENPDKEFHPTARRIRKAKRDPDSHEWDGEAFGNATPEQRQRMMAEIIAKQKAKKARQ